jgi:50S ribosomal protein L16 3-hydroxylase
MRDYWHKRPLLVRHAIPSFALAKAQGQALQSPISANVLFGFAGNDANESRLVKSKPWQLEHGPFRKGQIPSLKSNDWTLLVQGVEARHPAAANVLSWFRFIPDARLDDLMISIAGVGGGVGPHVDSYDVFLIQMEGRRRWKISAQSDLSLREDLPLKILARFEAKEDWVLEPGDLLYLPPHIAHEGIALDAGCQTWSVGFRAPSWRELLQETLWRLADQLDNDISLEQLLSDPVQAASIKPASIPKRVRDELKNRFLELPLQGQSLTDLLEFTLGEILSEPKPQIVFEPPTHPLSEGVFRKTCLSKGITLLPQTRLQISGDYLFCNGALMAFLDKKSDAIESWLFFAHQRGFQPAQCRRFLSYPSMFEPIYEAYLDGWLQLGKPLGN